MTALLTLSGLGDDEKRLARALSEQLDGYNVDNRETRLLYEGKLPPRTPAFSVPPQLRNIETVLGWPSLVVDVLEERLDWEGWVAPGTEDAFGLKEVYSTNFLDVEAPLGHLDALIYGVGFIAVGSGDSDEPDPLITIQSPTTTTAFYDSRRRRLSAGYTALFDENGEPDGCVLYFPDQTIRVTKKGMVADRDVHKLGRVLLARLTNRTRADRTGGRSEITRPVRALTDAAVRTLLGMEVNREFFSAPQRYLLGGEESMFQDADGNPVSPWQAIMGRIWNVPRDENGETPQVGQFPTSSPGPYLEQVRGLAQLLAAEASLPPSYLGFEHENPTSADAIRQAEARLIKRAERRQTMFSPGWLEVARLALLVRDGRLPEDFSTVRAKWRDAGTPTRSAAADETVKLIGAGVLPANSEVALDRLDFDETEKAIIITERRRAAATARLQQLAAVPLQDKPQEDAQRPSEAVA